jgi:hypothetical protein
MADDQTIEQGGTGPSPLTHPVDIAEEVAIVA